MDESDFGKGIFSDDDEIPVDMEMLKEKINLVPLADMDFGEAPDDLMDIDCSIQNHILAPLSLESSEQMDFKGSLKLDIEHSQIEPNGEETILKRVKMEASNGGLDVGGTTVTAAKVAAEVSADIVTGGVVAENGPPPDFSSWTVEDDILLKNAMEVGAAIEALAKGAVKFSKRYTAQELRARWRALLYDPVISEESALRMMKSDACLPNPTKLTNLNRLKYPQVSNKKRKLKSVRASFYKMRKKMAADLSTNSLVLKVETEAIEPLSGIVASKESELCVEENMFSQMFELFASGGVGEVVQAVPSGLVDGDQKDSSVKIPEQKDGEFLAGQQKKSDTFSQEHMLSIEESNSLATSQILCSDPSKTTIESGTVDNLQLQKDDGQQNLPPTAEPDTTTGHMSRKLSPIILGKGDVDAAKQLELNSREGKTTYAIDSSNKTECVDLSNVENMICVLNTEDTDIPSPPPGSAMRVPSLFSNMYFASEIKAEKSELGRMGSGYEGGDDFVASRNELLPLTTQEKNNADVVVKPEPCTEVHDTTTAQGVLPSSSSSACAIPQMHGNESMDVSENSGKSWVLLSKGKVKNTDDISAVVDHPTSQTEVVPGSINESVFPSDAGVCQLEQEFRYTDQTANSLTTVKGGVFCQDYNDGLESDEELPNFSDVEAMILDMDLDPVFDEDALARAESRRLYRRHRKTLMRLEQGANAALDRALTLQGAIAVFYGYYLRYFITKNEVTLGRMTMDSAVDIDLGKEGRANKVSRKQATIKLKKDGVFYLKNLGRRDLSVNNIPIPYGQHAHLGSNCLIEVGGMRFVFEINKKLVKQHVAEMHNSLQQHGGEVGIKKCV